MFRLLADENFDHDILRALSLQLPNEIDVVVSQEVGLTGTEDSVLLAWAAVEQMILLTHDEKTIPKYAYYRVEKGEPMPGVFVLPQTLPIGKAIEQLVLIFRCSQQREWQNIVQFIPL